MSRALEADVRSSLETGDAQYAYLAIAKSLIPPRDDAFSLNMWPPPQPPQLLEIEIFSSRHPLFIQHHQEPLMLIQDDLALAISKLALVQAFFVARNHLSCYLERRRNAHRSQNDDDRNREDSAQNSENHNPSHPSADELMTATAIMLLMDPEHLTAANTRKRILSDRLREVALITNTSATNAPSTTSPPTAAVTSLIRRECHLIDSMLTSPLHRHSKSPTLWSHRRWLVQTAQSLGMTWDPLHDLRYVILCAAEQHPRNYYAWHHLRWLLFTCNVMIPSPRGLPTNAYYPLDVPHSQTELVMFGVRDWCIAHPTDTSGWSMLALFSLLHPQRPTAAAAAEHFAYVVNLVRSFRWSGEAVWVFLRTLANLALGDGRLLWDEFVRAAMAVLTEERAARIARGKMAEAMLRRGLSEGPPEPESGPGPELEPVPAGEEGLV